MVKGSSKSLRNSGVGLVLECRNEELSDAQILHRKKQLEDIFLLQAALQGNTQTDLGLSGALGIPVLNGGSGFHNISSASKESTAVVKPGQSQFRSYRSIQRNVNGNTGGLNGISTKRKIGYSVKENASKTSPITTPTIPAPQQSLTQVLRATRKVAGGVATPPQNSVTQIDDDEIEVLQEKRSNVPFSKPGDGMSPFGGMQNRPILPRPNMAKPGMKNPAQYKGNNLLLLNVNVRPRNLAPVTVNSMKRKELDGKVKVILMKSPSEFVEWLLRQGLIRSQQLCNTHKTLSRQPTKLKLGMFSDPKILTISGGYVWIGECCGRKYISVYSGSLFGSTPIDKVPPTSVLKLVYHWSCQTSISNVETWVKVEKSFVSKIYHYLKCICSVILHDKIYDFGYEGTPVELGIVSLGTTTADGSKKAVKVEILGLYDRKNKSYRLFASTPEPASNSKERFLRILKPVKEVVHRNAKIICDQSVDPTCLQSMGYPEVEVCTSSENENDPKTNSVIMFYLRKHVPKMFQAALSQLTEHQVQLTLDELSWREKFASTSFDCYDNIMENIAYLTYRELENPGVLPLLEFVAEYPHNNFRYKTQIGTKGTPSVPASVILAPTNSPLNVISTQYNENKCLVMTNKIMTKNGTQPNTEKPFLSVKNMSSLSSSSFKPQPLTSSDSEATLLGIQRSNDYKNLEPYFYGRIEGNPSLGKEFNSYIYKCHLCSEVLEDNILFYSHLKYHYEGQTVEKDKLDLMCPYCTIPFSSVNALNKHKIDVHLMSDLTQVWCRICAEKFLNESLLKTHMMRKHVEAELPYRCEVCHYATSFYYEIINHFTRNHKGTPYVQCHFCLCVKTLTPNGASSFSTRLFQHMQKHAQKTNCRSCVLVFYSKYLLNEHKKEHLSCANVNGVTRYESANGYRLLQFKPNIRSMPIGLTAQVTSLQTKNHAALSITELELPDLRLDLSESETDYKCIECENPLRSKFHFNHYRKCAKCSYYSCCQNMIMKHAQVFHPPNAKKPLPYFIGNPIALEDPLFCICGFSTQSGHHMANHLATCQKKSAYPYPERMEPPYIDSSVAESQVYEIDPMELMEVDHDDDDDGELPILPLSVEIEEVEPTE